MPRPKCGYCRGNLMFDAQESADNRKPTYSCISCGRSTHVLTPEEELAMIQHRNKTKSSEARPGGQNQYSGAPIYARK